jgi:hypothetical protein|tara:strand:+ start:226 stop:438 length:213 start_codon:yes stop_codon:yes gene_type:complete
MPIKFKPSQTVMERGTGKRTTTNYYIKQTPKEELFDYINGSNSKPKIKNKCRNELVRRGIEIVYVPKEGI